MRNRILCSLVSSVIAVGILGAQTKPTIKNVTVKQTSPLSGQEMFTQYCAACHGISGRGNGPAAPALKSTPPDLTKLTAANSGSFPELRVMNTLSEQFVSAHGSREMPVWGDLLKSLDANASVAQLRVANLTSYIKSIQVK
ncbi:MAG TPA: cytochrome c [Bryobacteraceae bacterium]|nr:cytochrome c [Bryobacteraceae bacterium]